LAVRALFCINEIKSHPLAAAFLMDMVSTLAVGKRRVKLILSAQALVLVLLASSAAYAQAPGPAASPPSRPIKLGDVVRGELTPGSPRHTDGTPYDSYVFQGRKGESVAVGMKASTFDSFLVLRKQDEGRDLANDDDSGGGRDALLRFTLPADGAYEIRANAVARDGLGLYSLSFSERADVAADAGLPGAIPLRSGQPVSGALTDASPLHDDLTPYQSFRFRGQAGERVAVDMKSAAFDSYLVVRRAGSTIDVVANDDSGGGSDARVVYTLPATGDYEVRANAVVKSARGPFTVTLSPGPARPPVRVMDMVAGQVVRGELNAGDALGPDETLYDVYRFRGQPGQRIVIQALSDQFDPFIALHRPGQTEPLATDDDSGEGSDSQLSFTLSQAGDYDIHVGGLTTDEKGKYILGLSLRPR